MPTRLSGIFKLAGVSSIGGATLVVPTFKDAQRWFDRVGRTSVVYLQAEPGVSPTELKKRVVAAVPSDVKVQTGEQNADEQTSNVESSTNFITYALLAFAGAAVFVGLFIIFNTYSITVAQRIREFAMLRTLGASRRQVLRSVLAEAGLMGLVASVLGIGLGILLAIGLNALFKAVGVDLPTAAISIPLVTAVLLPLAVGVGAALIASVAPAIRATRVPPIAALREGFVLPPGRLAPYVPYIGLAAAVLGVGLIAYAIRAGGGGSRVLLTMAAGAIIAFLGVAMLSRILITPMAAVLGVVLVGLLSVWRLLGRLRDKVPVLGRFVRWLGYVLTLGFVWIGGVTILLTAIILISSGASTGGVVGALVVLGIGGALTVFLWIRRPREWPWDPASPTAGRLARENTARNPGRTAVTSAALMIGVALIVFVATFVNGFKDSFLGAIDRSITSDLIIQGQNFGLSSRGRGQSRQSGTGRKDAPPASSSQRPRSTTAAPTSSTAWIRRPSRQVYKFDWLNGGSNSLLTSLGPDQALIEKQFAKSHDLSPGDTFTLTGIDGNKLHAGSGRRVQGSQRCMTGLIIPSTTFDQFAPGNKDPGDRAGRVRPGPPGPTRQAVDHPGAQVRSPAQRCRPTPSTRPTPRASSTAF